jgi:hypothetical protein
MVTPKDKLCPDCNSKLIGRYSPRCASCAMKKRVKENNGKALGKPFAKGNKPYCYGKSLSDITKDKIRKAHIGMKYSQETIEKRRVKMIGHKVSEETRKKIGLKSKGRKHSESEKIKMSVSQKERFKKSPVWNKGLKLGERAPNWRGGVSLLRSPRRYGDDWAKIRYLVYKRDKFTCQECGINNVKLDVHHIIPFLLSKDNSIDNLITLCRPCHMRVERLYTKQNKEKFKNGN